MIDKESEKKRELIKAIKILNELLGINVVKENEYWRAKLVNTTNQIIESLGAMLVKEELKKSQKRSQ